MKKLSGGEDWLIRPVCRGMIQFESLKNGAVDLSDIFFLNEVIDTMDENERRIRKAASNG